MTPYILSIHTATETAIVNLSSGPHTRHTIINTDTKKHAAFLHSAIDNILKKENISMKSVSAVSVTNGPGSYTGIRIGLAAAKGFCYALKIPLITCNSLELLALSAIEVVKDADALYCAMIDARRMEVYTAVYNFNGDVINEPAAKVLTENSFREYSNASKLIFMGNGAEKFKQLSKNPGFCFPNIEISSETLSRLSWEKYQKNENENISLTAPLYLKEFYTGSKEIV